MFIIQILDEEELKFWIIKKVAIKFMMKTKSKRRLSVERWEKQFKIENS